MSLISSGSTLAGDIRYALGHWSGLTRFLEDVTAGNLLFDDWSDAIEDNGCGRMRRFIEMMLEEKLDAALLRPRFGRRTPSDGDGEPPDIANGR